MRYAKAAVLLLVLGFLTVWIFYPQPRTPDARPRSGLFGHVVDANGPLADARVRVQADSHFILTDENGRFRLPNRAEPGVRVTAWKEGYFIAGAPADATPLVLTLQRLPAEDCEDYAWVSPDADPAGRHNCANCHGDIHREWLASAHARSATGRRFRNLYEGSDWHGRPGVGWNLLAEHPDGAGVCTACHAPTVPFSDPAYFDLRKVRDVAARGVHCDFCHKVAGVSNEQFGLTHGRFGFDLLRPAEGQLFFGPLEDVDRGEDAFAPVYKESRYCASCHEGTVFGVHVYSTYSEWLQSPARRQGKQCQTCHMAPSEPVGKRRIASQGVPRDARTLSNHRFLMGSQEEMLRSCLKVEAALTPIPEGIRADVTVRAEDVGHRVPTGFADRNLVLTVEAMDRAGTSLSHREGPTLPSLAGPEQGRAGRLFAKALSDFEGRSPVPFWRARPEMTDTRLEPGRPERLALVFPETTERVRVRLLYRRFWPEVAQTKAWPDNEIVVVDRWLKVQPP